MKKIECDVLLELPKNQILESLAVVMQRYTAGPFLSYLMVLAEVCKEERGFFIEPDRFYHLLLGLDDDILKGRMRRFQESEIEEILSLMPQIFEELLRLKNPLVEKFVFRIYCLNPTLIHSQMEQLVSDGPFDPMTAQTPHLQLAH